MFGKSKKHPYHDVGRSREAAEYLASQLEQLMALPLATAAEVNAWYQECDAVEMTLQRQFPQFEPFHEVWHFFADADIRGRDPGCREHQHQLMSEYIQHLRQERLDA
jgi:hypothetical protein